MSRPDPTTAMSVVVLAPRALPGLEPLLGALGVQTIADRLEVLIVVERARERLAWPDMAPASLRLKMVPLDAVRSRAHAYAAGIEAATAPLVAPLEDHARPAPDWAEAMAEAHRGAWAVAGSRFVNANPGSAASRASFLVAFGAWALCGGSRKVEALPWLNVCYKREALNSVPGPLAERLAHRTAFVRDLARRRGGAFLTDGTVLGHANPDRLSSMIAMRFLSGRLSAAARAARRRWNLPSRVLDALGTPVGAVRRLLRSVPLLVGPGAVHGPHPATLVALLAALVADAAGRTLGDLAGTGDATRRYAELHDRIARTSNPGTAVEPPPEPRLRARERRAT